MSTQHIKLPRQAKLVEKRNAKLRGDDFHTTAPKLENPHTKDGFSILSCFQ